MGAIVKNKIQMCHISEVKNKLIGLALLQEKLKSF